MATSSTKSPPQYGPARLFFWIGITLFILSFLHPELIVLDTPPTGGDTAGHFMTLVYLNQHLLPLGRLVGWMPGNYAGFPLFQMYFPFPFLIMSLFGLVMPLTVAFKIISLAGVLGLPYAVFSFLRNLEYDDPVPDLGAFFSLAFLFMEANSAWGGNITSTLAGEFCYSFGLFLCLIYLGRLYHDIRDGRRVVQNAFLLALVGFSHGYSLIFCVIGAGFFLMATDHWLQRLAYILEVNLLAFCLMGFWLIPLLVNSPYTTAFNFVWIINSWREVLPEILWPVIVPGVIGPVFSLLRRSAPPVDRTRAFFLIHLISSSIIFYFIGFKIGLVDIRFLPFGQLFLVISGAAALGCLLSDMPGRSFVVLGLALGVFFWCAHHENHFEKWARWNFSGWEDKKLWPAYKDLSDYLTGDFSNPRIIYEHSPVTNGAGTVRAFESLPYHAGRATLEGIYIQASLSAPFVFHLQSEVSPAITAPLRTYNYGRFDLNRARGHLDLFNVSQYITVSREARRAALANPDYMLEKDFPPFSVFHLRDASERYVVQPGCRPILVSSRHPKKVSFEWFRRGVLDVPLVFDDGTSDDKKPLFAGILSGETVMEDPARLPCRPIDSNDRLAETVKNEEIIIENAQIGNPLWIRVSYNPGWKVEGAAKVWRASPCFMMVFPEKSRVRLYFGPGFPEYLGLGLTILGCLYGAYILIRHRFSPPGVNGSLFFMMVKYLFRPVTPHIRPRARLVLGISLTAGVLLVFVLILAVGYDEPVVYFNQGLEYFQKREYDNARQVFSKAMDRFPLSPVIDQTIHYSALSWYNQGRYDRALEVWAKLTRDYPESRLLAEVYFHIGLCRRLLGNLEGARSALAEVLIMAPPSPWAEKAKKLLSEIERDTH